jgi:predicted DCC family thiol-disulfide oxidoreductase YuxK
MAEAHERVNLLADLSPATRASDAARVPYSYRSDPHVPAFPDDHPIIVFDGVCVLCTGFAQFVLSHDAAARFRVLAAQSPLGHALYLHYGLDPKNYETNVLIADGVAWFKSEAGIRILEGLGLPWSLASLARIVPRPLRDRLYDVVARNRLRMFGRHAHCHVPSAEQRARFLDERGAVRDARQSGVLDVADKPERMTRSVPS